IQVYADWFDPRTRPWYKQALENNGQVSITAPYVSKSTDDIVITITQALPDGSGVIGIDLNISTLRDITNEKRIGETGYASLLDNNKYWITQPD
ncbi:cache domain-containing protein, partial [Lysinibacillus sp. D4B1_S16]|uniref:cache domain-containing protein n=1 Tax=Lysinibacillus sp. D4B1_S16 TaxID=2941231 RepID=UPI0020C0B390